MIDFRLTTDSNGRTNYGIAISTTGVLHSLSANTPITITVPDEAKLAFISEAGTGKLLISDSAITIPSAGQSNNDNVLINIPLLDVTYIKTLHIVSLADTVVSVQFYTQ